MTKLLQILSELVSGRGTARRVLDGAALQAQLARRHPSVSRFASATSPRQARRGLSEANLSNAVIPDLIRDKAFLRGLSSGGGVAKGSGTPDQVRGDDEGGGGGVTYTTLFPTTPVTPAQAGVPLFFSDLSSGGGVAKGSGTPDQVRGDEIGKVGFLRAFAHSNPVILSSFQDPFLGLRRSVVTKHNRAAGSLRQGATFAARWGLESKTCLHKQVQHDDVVGATAALPIHGLINNFQPELIRPINQNLREAA